MSKHTPILSPRDLLKKTSKARLEDFKSFTIKHPLLLQALDELCSAILDPIPGSIIFLFGLTGVGKTTLLEYLCMKLTELLHDELKEDKGRIPVVKVQLDSPLPGKFDWKDYFRNLLVEMNEPLINRKLNMGQWPIQHVDTVVNETDLILNNLNSASGMRFSAIQALLQRKPLAVLVDDAQHFGAVGSGRKLIDQTNIIKSMADKSRATHVLSGTYELVPLRNLNGQLSRRSTDIYFKRYRADNEPQRQQFISVLYTFQQRLPLGV
jgi:Cdc6-like AAA superfamily ATPase